MTRSCTFFIVCALLLLSSDAFAQGGIGASYERREHEPSEGIGLRFEKAFGYSEDLLNFGIVGHTSFFSNTITLRSRENGTGVLFADSELSTFDLGAALKLAVNLPLVTPYAMGGLGFENFKIRLNKSFDGLDVPDDESSMVINGTVGIQVRLVSSIRPFAEVRFSKNTSDYAMEQTFADLDASRNRVAFGVQLQF